MPSLLSGSVLRSGGSNTFIQLSQAQPQLPESETTQTGFTVVTDNLLRTSYRSSLGYLAIHSGTITNQLPGKPIEILATGTSTVLISGTQTSTSTTTGALIVNGGVGIAGTVHIDDNDIIVNRRYIGALYGPYRDNPNPYDDNRRNNIIIQNIGPAEQYNATDSGNILIGGGGSLRYDPIPQEYTQLRTNHDNIVLGVNGPGDNNMFTISVGNNVLTDAGRTGTFKGTITNVVIDGYTFTTSTTSYSLLNLTDEGHSFLEPTQLFHALPEKATTILVVTEKLYSYEASGFIGADRDSAKRYKLVSLIRGTGTVDPYSMTAVSQDTYYGIDHTDSYSTLHLATTSTHNFMPGMPIRVFGSIGGYVDGVLNYSFTNTHSWTISIPPNVNALQQMFRSTVGYVHNITGLGDTIAIADADDVYYTLYDSGFYENPDSYVQSFTSITPANVNWQQYETGVYYDTLTITVTSQGTYTTGDTIRISLTESPLDWWVEGLITNQTGPGSTIWTVDIKLFDPSLGEQGFISDKWSYEINGWAEEPYFTASDWTISLASATTYASTPKPLSFFGLQTYNNTPSSQNIAVGHNSASNLHYGNQNFFFGDSVAPNLIEGSRNFFMGHDIGIYLTSVNNCISIGGDNIVDNVDDQINIGSIFYYNGDGYLALNGDVGLGLGDPALYGDPDFASLSVLGGADISQNLIVRDPTASSNFHSGSIVAEGGIGVNGNMYVKDHIHGWATTATNLAWGDSGSIPYQLESSSTVFIPIGSTGTVLKSDGSTPYWDQATATIHIEHIDTGIFDLVYVDPDKIWHDTDTLYSTGRITYDGNTGMLSILSSATYALTVVGGAEIQQSLEVVQDIHVFGNAGIDGDATIYSTATSVNASSGALVVAGGAGIGENLNVGVDATIQNNLVVNNTVTTTHVYSDDGGENNLLYVPRVFVQSTAPSSPRIGEFWYDITTGGRYQYVDDGGNKIWVGF